MPKSAQPAPLPPPDVNLFPIVGIGASAGGLEALEQFLRHIPAENGMAFVIAYHLSVPHREANAVEGG